MTVPFFISHLCLSACARHGRVSPGAVGLWSLAGEQGTEEGEQERKGRPTENMVLPAEE